MKMVKISEVEGYKANRACHLPVLVVIMQVAPFEEKQAISIRRNFWVQLNGQFCMMKIFVVHV